MRTTVILDKDVERMLREAMHRSRQSFQATLNNALRAGLSSKRPQDQRTPFLVKTRPLGLRAGIDPASFNHLADELEADAFLEKALKDTQR